MQDTAAQVERLAGHLRRHERWFVLTGAGVSTRSGIPDYRDGDGGWKRRPPVTIQAFVAEPLARARYWARSLLGWPRVDAAQPNGAHYALAQWSKAGRVSVLATQNVDGLHQRAGADRVIDLHGRLETVICLGCSYRTPRQALQRALGEANPSFAAHHLGRADAGTAPDGDVDLEDEGFASFRVPDCPQCGGILKPDVVFFGESVPRVRVDDAFAALDASDAMLVAGSSLMVYSGFRFAREAAALGKPVVAVNLGRTRADPLLADKIPLDCEQALLAAIRAVGD